MDTFNFDQAVLAASEEKAIVVDYWSPTCGPCRMLGPVLEKLDSESEEWELVKINTMEHQQLAMAHGIQSIPAVKMYSKGKIVSEFVGALPEPTLRKWLAEFLPNERKDRLNEIRDALAGDTHAQALEDLRAFVAENGDLPMGKIILASETVLADPVGARTLLEDIKLGHLLYENAETVRILADLVDFKMENGAPASVKLAATSQALKDRDYEAAIDNVVEAVVLDKHYANDLPRRGAIALFRLFGPRHPLTEKYRRKFEMALY